MSKIYTGIGSRSTPAFVCDLITATAAFLGSEGWMLYSGGAPGADKAFETGCDEAQGTNKIFLPWQGFEQNPSPLFYIPDRAFKLAEQFHPNWANCKPGAQRMLARDVQQVLGEDLSLPTDALICWTEGGSGKGGTGQALRVAKHYGIPILDLGAFVTFEEMDQALGAFYREQMMFP